MASSVAETSATIEQMTVSIDRVAQNTEELASSVTETSSTVEQMTVSIEQVAGNSQELQQVVNISHYDVRRPRRMQMSVQDPEVCYKCHQKIFGMNSLPSHHPVKEGKMVCGDCHDAHGQFEGNLKESEVNMVCYRCHADKQGPFVYEHPPVTENCTYCHQPHGTVANNLLRQQPPFLCLRCHSGHRGSHGNGNRTGMDNKAWLIGALYTDCTQCHANIHGGDQKAGGGSPFAR